MSGRFFYLELKFTPKGSRFTGQRQLAVEVSKELVRRKRSELLDENPREKTIALDLARRAAVHTFSTGTEEVYSRMMKMRSGVNTGLTSCTIDPCFENSVGRTLGRAEKASLICATIAPAR